MSLGDLGALARLRRRLLTGWLASLAHVVQSSACVDPRRPAARPLRPAPPWPAPGWRVEVRRRSRPSTNADVAARARAGRAGRAGRGRRAPDRGPRPARPDLGHPAARGADLLAAGARPTAVPVARWPWLPLLTGLAVVDAVRRVAGVDARAEVAQRRARRRSARSPGSWSSGSSATGRCRPRSSGVGLNVSSTARRAARRRPPPRWRWPGAGAAGPVRAARARCCTAFADRYDGWVGAAATAGCAPSYAAACSTLGREVRVDLPAGEPLHGRAVDVDDGRPAAGRRRHAGCTRSGAGDVVHVRPV